jgi:hypothetical protein
MQKLLTKETEERKDGANGMQGDEKSSLHMKMISRKFTKTSITIYLSPGIVYYWRWPSRSLSLTTFSYSASMACSMMSRVSALAG